MLPVIACYVILCSNSSGIQLRHFTRQSRHHDQTVVSSEPHEYETIDDVRDTILKNSEALKDMNTCSRHVKHMTYMKDLLI